MSSTQSSHKKLDILKEKAKEMLSKRDIAPDRFSGKNQKELIESLQLYQVELEIQNQELIRSREEVERNEDRFKNIFNHAPVGYCIISSKGLILDANSTFYDYLNRKPSQVIGRRFEEFISIESQDEYYFHSKNVKEKEEASTLISIGNVSSQMHFKLFSRRLQLTKDEDLVTLCTLNDVTNETNYQRQLVESEARFRSLVDSIDDVVFTLDTQQRHTGVYGKWLERLNQKPSDYLGKTAAEVMNEEQAAIHKKNNELALQGENVVYEWSVNHPTGRREMQTSLSPIYNVDKEVVGIVGVARDITVSILAKEDLTERTKELSCLYSILSIGHRADISLEQYLQSCVGIIPEGFKHVANAQVKIVVNSSVYTTDNFCETKNCIQTPILIDEREIGEITVCYNQGVTEEHPFIKEENKLLELISKNIAQVISRETVKAKVDQSNIRLQELNAEKDKVLSVIGHDLRGPLSTILGISQLLERKYNGLDPSKRQELIKGISKTSGRLYELLENLLDWARLQRGAIKFNPSRQSVQELARYAANMYNENFVKKQVVIDVDIEADIFVFADTNMAESVLRNLISNALKFTRRYGVVSINASRVDNEWVEIAVSDNGIGMDKDILDNLFKIECNIGREGTDKESSSGFGLLLCKDFVVKHGGQIWANSKVDEGSTFHFTLPAYTD